jgi:hypothetical protein
MARLLTIVVVLSLAAPVFADTIRVDWLGTGDYESIGEGVAAAGAGDTVLVAPGTYMGENNRDIYVLDEMTIMSEGGRRSVTINAQGEGIGFRFEDFSANSVLSGFTIQNGSDTSSGGGVVCDGCATTITDCSFVACTATAMGGGLFAGDGATPTLIDVTFTSCQSDVGAGMCALAATPSLTRVRFAGNMAVRRGGGLYCESAPGMVEVTDCVFHNNSVINAGTGGGGLWLFSCPGTITGTTFTRNRANLGTCVRLSNGASATIENCILSFGRWGRALHRGGDGEPVTTTRCVVYGNEYDDVIVGTVTDTLLRDPRFCGMLGGDLTLCSNSPALPDHNPWTVLMGAHGEGCGDCNSPVEDATWGRIKELYR